MTGAYSDSDPRSALERVALAYERSNHFPGSKRPMGSRWTLVDQIDVRGTRYALARYEAPRGIGRLTQRERQVLELLAIGHTTKLAAHQLGIAVPTVRVLLVRAVNKLGARNRREAIRRYLGRIR